MIFIRGNWAGRVELGLLQLGTPQVWECECRAALRVLFLIRKLHGSTPPPIMVIH